MERPLLSVQKFQPSFIQKNVLGSSNESLLLERFIMFAKGSWEYPREAPETLKVYLLLLSFECLVYFLRNF